jgi:DNA-binding NtrC family response regulator
MDILAAECGWSFEHAENLGQLREIGIERDLVAVLIDASALDLPTKHALQSVLEVLPKTLPIVCHKSSETIRWSELAEAGAFHALLLPLRASEVRQSLGFVWEAQRRLRSRIVVLRRLPPVCRRGAQATGLLA